MAWCHKATNQYLNQCWPRSMLPIVRRPQWVNHHIPPCSSTGNIVLLSSVLFIIHIYFCDWKIFKEIYRYIRNIFRRRKYCKTVKYKAINMVFVDTTQNVFENFLHHIFTSSFAYISYQIYAYSRLTCSQYFIWIILPGRARELVEYEDSIISVYVDKIHIYIYKCSWRSSGGFNVTSFYHPPTTPSSTYNTHLFCSKRQVSYPHKPAAYLV